MRRCCARRRSSSTCSRMSAACIGRSLRPTTATAQGGQDASAHEYLLSYLQWLDPERADLPPRFIARLERALARYGVHGLERSPQLEDAVFWLYSSVLRADLLAPTAAAILQRRLSRHDALAHTAGPGLRALLDRLAA